MPIEDVDFMKSHGEKQSYVFLVDSKDRDKNAWQTPAEYVVEFTAPFRNVVGMDVLDASVPRTMYNVDVTNNKIAFYIGPANTATAAALTVATVDPGDYTIQTVTVAINAVLKNAAGEQITCEPLSTPPDVKNILRFRCAKPFVFDMQQSTMAETLGFDELTVSTEAAKPPLQRNYNIPTNPPPTPANRQLFASVDLDSPTTLGPVSTVFEGPRGVILSHKLAAAGPIAQRFVLAEDGYFTGVYVALAGTGTGAAFEIRETASGEDRPGIVVPDTDGTIALSAIDGTLSDGVPATKVKLTANTVYWLVINQISSGNNDISVYYNDAIDTATTLKYQNPNTGLWQSYDSIADNIFYKMSARIETAQPYHAIQAPGIFSLVGERYIVLRCREIEEASYRSLAYSKHTLGLAKFKLGVVGYSENRLDFSSVPAREFHPIGKLSKMTFRFERPTGELYDFKGVNHTITLAVKYYEPVQRVVFERSSLNPNYNGDLAQYLIDEGASDEDSDDQEYEYSRDQLANYKKNEAEYFN